MSYKQLVQDYQDVTGRNPEIYYGEGKYLNKACPGQVCRKDRIVIWRGLTGDAKVEAEAHELGHILLRYRGLIAFDVVDKFGLCDSDTYRRSKDFCQEVNNAISHRHLLTLLHDTYGIPCLKQRELRTISQEDFISAAEDFPDAIKEWHHIKGIIAYDIVECGFRSCEDVVDNILGHFPHGREIFKLCCDYLSEMKPGEDIGVQIRLFTEFAAKLGYPPRLFKLFKPFPLGNEEHDRLFDCDFQYPEEEPDWMQIPAMEKAKELWALRHGEHKEK